MVVLRLGGELPHQLDQGEPVFDDDHRGADDELVGLLRDRIRILQVDREILASELAQARNEIADLKARAA